MLTHDPQFTVRIATGAADLQAAARLRYDVFIREMGGTGPLVDHTAGEERDAFDGRCTQLILYDQARPAGDQVVGLYRLMSHEAGDSGFYSESEFDLTPLRESGRRLMELGRSCLHPDYRGGAGMHHLWQALATHVQTTGAEILFGVASLPGTDAHALAAPLSLLHHEFMAPEPLRPRSRVHQPMDLLARDRIDRSTALRAVPALIKAYLRLGGRVGDGAFVDQAFKVTDVCLVLDTRALNPRQAAIYATDLPT
jgi:L-ornithine Nalpha-acyltransferase